MFIDNRSSRHPTNKLHPLIDFVCKRTSPHVHTILQTMDHPNSRRTTCGQAWKEIFGKPLIQLVLGAGLRYPRRTRHVPEVGWVTLKNWDEEVLFVLAHEIQHVDDFMTELVMNDHEAEVRAETFAYQVLQQWRSARQKRATI